jgi:hypothetical protein
MSKMTWTSRSLGRCRSVSLKELRTSGPGVVPAGVVEHPTGICVQLSKEVHGAVTTIVVGRGAGRACVVGRPAVARAAAGPPSTGLPCPEDNSMSWVMTQTRPTGGHSGVRSGHQEIPSHPDFQVGLPGIEPGTSASSAPTMRTSLDPSGPIRPGRAAELTARDAVRRLWTRRHAR